MKDVSAAPRADVNVHLCVYESVEGITYPACPDR